VLQMKKEKTNNVFLERSMNDTSFAFHLKIPKFNTLF